MPKIRTHRRIQDPVGADPAATTGAASGVAPAGAGRPWRPGRWLAATSALLGGLAMFGLTGDPSASATSPPPTEYSMLGPATGAVYGLSVPGSANGPTALMISAVNSSPNAISLQTVSSVPFVAASSEWQFTPAPANSGGSLSSGFGELANRWSASCLTASGTGTTATVGQATCTGAASQEWTAVTNAGVTYLESQATGQTVGFNAPSCAAAANVTLNLGNPSSGCGGLAINEATYTFYTDPVVVPSSAPGYGNSVAADPQAYSCAAGYNFPAIEQAGGYSDYEFQNDSTGAVTPEAAWALNDQTVLADSIVYRDPSRNGGTGQVLLECDPGQLSGYPLTNAVSIAKVGALTTQEVEVNQSDNPSVNGGVVDTWQQVAAGRRPVSNELWAYVPDSESVGYGELVSQSSGKCLEVNGTTGVVDQWDCVPEAANELWHVSANASFSGFGAGFSLQVLSSGKYLGVNPSSQNEYRNGTWYDPGWVNGTPLVMMVSPSQATAWTWGA